MTERAWSLARRLTAGYLVATTVFVLVISATSAVFLWRAVEREITSLVREELYEFETRFDVSDQTIEAFAAITSILEAQHSSNPLAWRVYEPMNGTLWAERGPPKLLDALAAHERGEPASDPNLRFGSRILHSRYRVELALDATYQRVVLEDYLTYAAVLLAASIASTAVVGGLFFRRISSLLRLVADRARAVREPGAPLPLPAAGAPREIRDIEDALREMIQNIRRETEQARIFTAGLAHELRSPVQNLIGESEVTLIAPRDAATYRDVLVSHLDELRRLGDAIDNLVTICSASETRRTRARETFDLAQEAAIRLQRERTSAERHGERLDVAVRGDMKICGDREGILRALRNLTANAVQWTAPGSTVNVDLDGAAKDVVITVDDAGPGVPVELREKIFEPFYRGPAARGGRIGYGLGLALARSAVDAQGGRIEVGTSPAGGARFRVVLPRQSRAED